MSRNYNILNLPAGFTPQICRPYSRLRHWLLTAWNVFTTHRIPQPCSLTRTGRQLEYPSFDNTSSLMSILGEANIIPASDARSSTREYPRKSQISFTALYISSWIGVMRLVRFLNNSPSGPKYLRFNSAACFSFSLISCWRACFCS